MMSRPIPLLILGLLLVAGAAARADDRFLPPGDLLPGSGEGIAVTEILYPDLRFPLEEGPAYANSPTFGPGGARGGGGEECDAVNYSYPWRDNFCELRRSDIALCVSGGHFGQDLRPKTCEDNTHWAVAAADGVIAHVGRFSITLQSRDGTLFRYVHLAMDELAVAELDTVKAGDRIGKVSNDWLTWLPVHLHFDVKDTVRIGDATRIVFVPPYSSLVRAYGRLEQ